MSTEAMKALAREHMELLSQHDLEGALQHYRTDARCNGFAPQPLDLDGYQHSMAQLLAAFPDARFSIDDLVAEGDKVVIRHQLQGTHRGTFQGIPPTGKPVTMTAIGILRMVNGQIAETWLNADFLGLLQQLGAIPSPEQMSA
jgi:steroid delta-isomerase-like uncharacterized protein